MDTTYPSYSELTESNWRLIIGMNFILECSRTLKSWTLRWWSWWSAATTCTCTTKLRSSLRCYVGRCSSATGVSWTSPSTTNVWCWINSSGTCDISLCPFKRCRMRPLFRSFYHLKNRRPYSPIKWVTKTLISCPMSSEGICSGYLRVGSTFRQRRLILTSQLTRRHLHAARAASLKRFSSVWPAFLSELITRLLLYPNLFCLC